VSNIVLSVYSALMRLAQPLLRRKMANRSVSEPGYAQAAGERFGHYTQPLETSSQLVWLHAVSLGETRAAGVLLARLRAEHTGLRVLLTHGTATGRAEGKALLRAGDVQVWQPWDTRVVVERFFAHFKPRLGLLMETEVWPCAVAAAEKRGMPLVLCNGRLSEKSLQQALKMSPLAVPAYARLSAVYAQTDADAERYRQLGVANLQVFGNLKFDAALDSRQQAIGKAWQAAATRPVVMFASSREGEEALFLEKISATAQQIRAPEAINKIAVQWLIVPRHPQRFDEVAALVVRNGFTLSRRSSWHSSPFESIEAMQADVWLGDSLGEMALYYSLSSAALLGGSFAPLGGQNLIEAAGAGCPVVMGPHTFNFAEAAQLAEASGAAFSCADMGSAVDAAVELVSDEGARVLASSAGVKFATSHQGAAHRHAQALAVYFAAPNGPSA
jgi:3-deoxy-D-manno-octulosonic-acid transferase